MSLLLLLPGLALAADPPAAPEATDFETAAVLVGLTGTGWVTVGDQAPIPLDRCIGVPQGATVCTDADSFATIRLASDPATPGAEDIVLLPQTCLHIEESTSGGSAVAMSRGGISVAADTDGEGELAVRTRDGTTAGSSGGFRVTLEQEATRTEAITGAVTLKNSAGTLDLFPGLGSRLRADRAPESPQELLRPDKLVAPEEGSSLRRPDFSWQPVPYSTGYRVELSVNPDFTDVVEAIDLPEASWKPELLFVPTQVEALWWRVSAYDRFGFLSVPTASRRLELPGGVQ